MVPTVASPLAMPFTLQVTALLDPVTVGMNCTLVPSRTVAEVGVIVRVTLELLLLPHPARRKMTTKVTHSRPQHAFMLSSPISVTLTPLPSLKRAPWFIQNVRLTVKRKVET